MVPHGSRKKQQAKSKGKVYSQNYEKSPYRTLIL